MPPASELEHIWAQIRVRPPLKPGEAYTVSPDGQIHQTMLSERELTTPTRNWLAQLATAVVGLLS